MPLPLLNIGAFVLIYLSLRHLKLVSWLCLLLCLSACERTVVIAPDAILPNGSKYLGELKDGKFHGQGKLIFAEGGYYQGQFRNGLFHGQGDYLTPEGSRYQGQFNDGRGTGKFEVYDAFYEQQYSGDLVDFSFQGQGRLEFDDSVYQGGFKDNRYHGNGTLTTDEGVYAGEFVAGSFTGEGRFESIDGYVNEGRFKDWLLHGPGKTVTAEGDVLEATFDNGYATGEGVFNSDTRGNYKGWFEYSQFQGNGTFEQIDGSVYTGGFEYGQYHGQGTLTKAASESGNEPQVLTGEWRYGEYVGAGNQGEIAEQQAELALVNHQRLLTERLSGLSKGGGDAPALFFLGMAGDGTQSVFRREVRLVEDFFNVHYGADQRSISLINDHETASTDPLATRVAFKQAVEAIAKVANLKTDVLAVYITTHGSQDHKLSIKHDGLKLPDLGGDYLAQVLKDSGFKHKLVLISACYSGGYIPLIDDGNSLIITASSETTTSFGCSDESELTYFGRALFAETLIKQPALSFVSAFESAQNLITTWEQDEELDASGPMIHVSSKVSRQLAFIRNAQTTGSTP